MVKVVVGSTNPVKIQTVEEAFRKFFDSVEVEGVKVSSDVPDQPIDKEVMEGAKNRALALKASHQADFYVGIEGGIVNFFGMWFNSGMVCIADREGNTGFGASPHFQLPNDVIQKLLQGEELGVVAGTLTNDPNMKEKGGIINHLTKGIMGRKDLYVPGVITALVPLLNKEMYFSSTKRFERFYDKPSKIFVATKAFIIYNGKILLVRESSKYKEGSNKGRYDVVGGRIELGQRFNESLLREIKEETGLSVTIGRPFFVNEWRPNVKGEKWQIIGTFFECHTKNGNVVLSEDHDDFIWIDPRDYKNHNLIPNLHDAFSSYLNNHF